MGEWSKGRRVLFGGVGTRCPKQQRILMTEGDAEWESGGQYANLRFFGLT